MKQLHWTYLVLIGITLILIARLSYLQLITDRYILNAYNTSIKQEITIPKRGDILDRNGKLLVTSTYDYDLMVTPRMIDEEFDTLGFSRLLGITPEQFERRILEITEAPEYYEVLSYPFKQGLSRKEYAQVYERLNLYPAFSVVQRPKRQYLVHSAGNVLGYINEARPSDIKKDSTYYRPGDFIGISGVEKSYEKVLRGQKGIKHLLADNKLRRIGSYKNGRFDEQAVAGSSIHLTIDYELQTFAESLLKGKRGAVVAIEPKSGEILVLASSPTIDPNRFLSNKGRLSILRDTINRPGYDRSSQGMYPPGSPFKLLTGLAGMQMGVIDTATAYTCRGGFRYGRRKLGCHCGTYYPIRIQTAIQRSCNNYFCSTYRDIINKYPDNPDKAIDEWDAIVESFGLGNYLNNDLAVGSPGLIPDSEYYNKYLGEGNWNAYRIISNAIGQGEILTTPLQMANFTAAIANEGYFYTPHILARVDGEPIKDSAFTIPKKTLVDKKHFKFVLDGMKRVVQNGTAHRIRTKYFTQAGKTGTAENPHGQDHSLFTLIAPVENPQIVVAVVVENGHYGATWAAPIASLVAEKYVTDTIRRPRLEKRMKNGKLFNEYERQYIRQLKRAGKYEEYLADSLDKRSIFKGY